MPDSDKTQEQILAAAADVIIRLGYDKTTVGRCKRRALCARTWTRR